MKIINKKIIKKNIDYVIYVRPITVIDIQVCKSFIVKLLISTLGFFTKKEEKTCIKYVIILTIRSVRFWVCNVGKPWQNMTKTKSY